jgi:hypothetical protein
MIRSLQKSKGSLGLGSIRHSSSAYFTRRPPIGLQSETPSVDHIGHLLFDDSRSRDCTYSLYQDLNCRTSSSLYLFPRARNEEV